MDSTKGFRLSLCVIAKNEEKTLPTMWESVKSIVDEFILVDTGSTDKTVEVAKKIGAVVYEKGDSFCDRLSDRHVDWYKQFGIPVKSGETIFNFSKARNFSFEKASGDYLFWLDCDDILMGTEELISIIKRNLSKDKQVGLHMLYKYETDDYGNTVVEHYRERIFPNNGTFKWRGRVHELVYPSIETSYVKVMPSDAYVHHNVASEKRAISGERNVKNLLLDLYEEGDAQDPRTVFYLAESLRKFKPDKALELYQKYSEMSGWDEELQSAATRVTDLYLKKGDNQQALEWAFKSIRFKPEFPSGYANVAQVFYALDKMTECELYCKLALQLEQTETLAAINNKHNRFTPLILLANCYYKRGHVQDALKVTNEALQFEANNGLLLHIKESCERITKEEKTLYQIKGIADYMMEEGESIRALNLLANVPTSHLDDPRVEVIKRKCEEVLLDRVKAGSKMREPKLEAGQELAPEYKMCLQDLKKHEIKTVLLVSPERFFEIGLRQHSCDVKRVSKLNKNVSGKFDAVIFDDCYHETGKLRHWLVEAVKYADKMVFFWLPNRSAKGVVQYTPQVTKEAMYGDIISNLPLSNGMIYGSFKIQHPEFEPARSQKKIAFICGGDSAEEWGPLSTYTGIGGSEEATIHISRELAKLGNKVTVFNQFPHQCIYERVEWRHHASLIKDEEFDVMILWRIPHHMDIYNFKAKKMYLWLHDVPETYWFSPERVEKLTKIIVLSKYHRTLLSDIPDEKFLISQNGVEPKDFLQDIERDQNRVIYTSSYDRGLEYLLNMWPDVKKECPKAELHIYYGWGTFDVLAESEKRHKWKSRMMAKIERLPDVYDHGRIGQLELAQEYLRSNVFAYPSHFDEISCISVMKAQVAGCVPLTTDYAALSETNLQNQLTVSGSMRGNEEGFKEFQTLLIHYLNNPITDDERLKISTYAIEQFAWENIALDWDLEFGGSDAGHRTTKRSNEARTPAAVS